MGSEFSAMSGLLTIPKENRWYRKLDKSSEALDNCISHAQVDESHVEDWMDHKLRFSNDDQMHLTEMVNQYDANQYMEEEISQIMKRLSEQGRSQGKEPKQTAVV